MKPDLYVQLNNSQWLGTNGKPVSFNGDRAMKRYKSLTSAKKALLKTFLDNLVYGKNAGIYTIDFSLTHCPTTPVLKFVEKKINSRNSTWIWEEAGE